MILLDSLHSFPKRINLFYFETFIWLTHLFESCKLQSCIFTWFLGCHTLNLKWNVIKKKNLTSNFRTNTSNFFQLPTLKTLRSSIALSFFPPTLNWVRLVNPFFEMRSSLSHVHTTDAMPPPMFWGALLLHFPHRIISTYSRKIYFPK